MSQVEILLFQLYLSLSTPLYIKPPPRKNIHHFTLSYGKLPPLVTLLIISCHTVKSQARLSIESLNVRNHDLRIFPFCLVHLDLVYPPPHLFTPTLCLSDLITPTSSAPLLPLSVTQLCVASASSAHSLHAAITGERKRALPWSLEPTKALLIDTFAAELAHICVRVCMMYVSGSGCLVLSCINKFSF